jgi:bacteriorhodopsin
MTDRNTAAALFDAADKELAAMSQDAQRWRYYASRVAAMLGVSIEQMAREVDDAIERDRESERANRPSPDPSE